MPPRGEQEGEREGDGGTAEQILQDRYAGVCVRVCVDVVN